MDGLPKVEMDRAGVDTVLSFLVDLEGVSYLRADDFMEGVEGYLVYRQADLQEVSIHLVWRVGKRITNVVKVEPDTSDKLLKKCMDEKWELYDDAVRHVFYFLRYADPEGEEESRAVSISIAGFKAIRDDRLGNRFRDYRKRSKEQREEKEKAREGGCIIPGHEIQEVMKCKLTI